MSKLLVTGGAGFIGSAFIRLSLAEDPSVHVVNLDKLTYAGNLENLEAVANDPRYRFVHGDVCDEALVDAVLSEEQPDAIVHFAAESHVDRSIFAPSPVFETNLRGTFTLLEAARRHHTARYLQVSTDEVYGSLEPPLEAQENFPLNPSSPYSASKAGADLLARSYFLTYKLPVAITRASNNYGPYHFPEKLIPLMISNALEDRPLPVYGDGMQVRDWLYVEDHCRGIRAVLEHGRDGEIYNIGGNCSLPNLEVIRRILRATGKPDSLIQYVTDRPGHDRRYALSSEKLMRETGWGPQGPFYDGLAGAVGLVRPPPHCVGGAPGGEVGERAAILVLFGFGSAVQHASHGPSEFAAWRRAASSGRAPLVALGFGPRTASAGSRIVPRHGFRGTLLTAPSKRLDAARPLPVDGCGLAFQRRQGSPTDTPDDRIGLGHYDRDPQRGGAEAGRSEERRVGKGGRS